MQQTTATVTDELRLAGVKPDGSLRVERKQAYSDHSTTRARYDYVPVELAAFIDAPAVNVADLPTEIRQWVDDETESLQ